MTKNILHTYVHMHYLKIKASLKLLYDVSGLYFLNTNYKCVVGLRLPEATWFVIFTAKSLSLTFT